MRTVLLMARKALHAEAWQEALLFPSIFLFCLPLLPPTGCLLPHPRANPPSHPGASALAVLSPECPSPRQAQGSLPQRLCSNVPGSAKPPPCVRGLPTHFLPLTNHPLLTQWVDYVLMFLQIVCPPARTELSLFSHQNVSLSTIGIFVFCLLTY